MPNYENITYENVTTQDLWILLRMSFRLKEEMEKEGLSEEEIYTPERWANFINSHAMVCFPKGLLRKDK